MSPVTRGRLHNYLRTETTLMTPLRRAQNGIRKAHGSHQKLRKRTRGIGNKGLSNSHLNLRRKRETSEWGQVTAQKEAKGVVPQALGNDRIIGTSDTGGAPGGQLIKGRSRKEKKKRGEKDAIKGKIYWDVVHRKAEALTIRSLKTGKHTRKGREPRDARPDRTAAVDAGHRSGELGEIGK